MLASLVAHRFRNLDTKAFCPGPGRHLLLGPNGAGKTSLLEAIYVAATTKSFRSARLADCVRHGESSFYVEALAGPDGTRRLEIAWSPDERRRTLDGQPSSVAAHLEAQPIVAWTSADVDVLTGPPELGRRLLDRVLVASRPSAFSDLARFRRTLEQKRELLAVGGQGLEGWNQVLAEAITKVASARREISRDLSRFVTAAAEATDGAIPAFDIEYRPSPREAESGPESVLESLEKRSELERLRRRPLIGSHRDRLVFLWNGREVKRVASAGERKAFSLLLARAMAALVVAQDRDPIVLLDDLDAELDEGRLEAIWKAFSGLGQVFATSNRGPAWKRCDVDATWRVESGSAGLANGRVTES